MLEWIHKHMKWLMWTIVIVTTVAFMFFGIWGPSFSGRAVVKVNGHVITAEELNRVYQRMVDYYRQQMKVQITDKLQKVLRRQALGELVTNQLMVQEAKRVGIRVSDGELQAYIMSIPAFRIAGRFDERAYRRALENINMAPAAFEENQRDDLLSQKLGDLVKDGISVSDGELQAAFAAKKAKVRSRDRKKAEAAFRAKYVEEKRNAALEAFVRSLQNKARIRIIDKEFTS